MIVCTGAWLPGTATRHPHPAWRHRQLRHVIYCMHYVDCVIVPREMIHRYETSTARLLVPVFLLIYNQLLRSMRSMSAALLCCYFLMSVYRPYLFFFCVKASCHGWRFGHYMGNYCGLPKWDSFKCLHLRVKKNSTISLKTRPVPLHVCQFAWKVETNSLNTVVDIVDS